jgi:SAM-dependent methyltransferase
MTFASARSVPESRIADVADYYRSILPFYEKESVSRAHLAFWRALAEETAPRRILELGSGLGRITAALHRVAPAIGVDLSLEMLARARARVGASGPAYVAADLRRPVARGAFDLVVAPGDPISHATSLRERRAILRAAAAALSPEGRLVIEGLYRRGDRLEMPVRRIRHADGELVIEEAWYPFGVRHLWHARYLYRDRLRAGGERTAAASFIARSWNPATVRDAFADAGLRVDALWGDFDRRPFSAGAPRMIIVASRRSRSSGRAGPAGSGLRAGWRARPSRRR